MLETQKAVLEFMEAMDLPLPNRGTPGLKNIKWELLRSLIDEEVNTELLPSMEQLEIALSAEAPDTEIVLRWWAEVVDALCDSIVVLHNTTNAMGLDLEPFFNEVHRTNMLKADGPVRADGKKLKPEGWEPPRIREMLERLIITGKP